MFLAMFDPDDILKFACNSLFTITVPFVPVPAFTPPIVIDEFPAPVTPVNISLDSSASVIIFPLTCK